jgi:hypothetical protein
VYLDVPEGVLEAQVAVLAIRLDGPVRRFRE